MKRFFLLSLLLSSHAIASSQAPELQGVGAFFESVVEDSYTGDMISRERIQGKWEIKKSGGKYYFGYDDREWTLFGGFCENQRCVDFASIFTIENGSLMLDGVKVQVTKVSPSKLSFTYVDSSRGTRMRIFEDWELDGDKIMMKSTTWKSRKLYSESVFTGNLRH